MTDLPRWLLVTIVVLCLVAMLVWARGTQHHHGQYVGAWDARQVSSPGSVV